MPKQLMLVRRAMLLLLLSTSVFAGDVKDVVSFMTFDIDKMNEQWGATQTEQKIENIATVISSINWGSGPDLVLLQNIPSQKVLEQLNERLEHLVYKTPLWLGEHFALLTRLPILQKDSDDLVEELGPSVLVEHSTNQLVELKVLLPDQKPVTVLAAKSDLDDSEQVVLLNQLADQNVNRSLLMGSFTFSHHSQLPYRPISDNWLPLHKTFCVFCLGTFYEPENAVWKFADNILFSKKSNLIDLPFRFKVIDYVVGQTNEARIPLAYNAMTGHGVSTHFPVLLELIFKAEEIEHGQRARMLTKRSWSTKAPVALFDVEKTLLITRSGEILPTSDDDLLLLPQVVSELSALKKEGYLVGLLGHRFEKIALKDYDRFMRQVVAAFRAEGVEIDYYDFNSGMADELPETFLYQRFYRVLQENYIIDDGIDYESSFYVGDMGYVDGDETPAGRPAFPLHFSSRDRRFAESVHFNFLEPGDYFGWWKKGVDLFRTEVDVLNFIKQQ